MSVGPLFAVLGLLTGRTATVGSCDVFLFLGLGLHLVLIGIALWHSLEHHPAAGNNIVNICHINGGKVLRQ